MYPQVIHIDLEPSFGDHVSEDMVHERLKGWGSVAKAKEHYGGFKETKRCDEHRFPFVTHSVQKDSWGLLSLDG